MTLLAVLLVFVIGAAVLVPFLYVVVTWDHDLVYTYVAACCYCCCIWFV